MRKQRKKYTRPKNLFDKSRIESDKELMKKYGLKNKSEIWKAESNIDRIRKQAKKIILEPEKQKDFFNRIERMGLGKSLTLDTVLALTKEDYLERRLQTIVFKLGLAKTIKQARQLITHRKIKIGDRIITIPSYIVKIEEENKISKIQEKSNEPKVIKTENKTKIEE